MQYRESPIFTKFILVVTVIFAPVVTAVCTHASVIDIRYLSVSVFIQTTILSLADAALRYEPIQNGAVQSAAHVKVLQN
jgi:hypothetical protein